MKTMKTNYWERKEKERIGNEGEKKTKVRDPVPIPHELSKEE